MGNSLPAGNFRVGHIPRSLGGWGQGAGAVVVPFLVPILGLNGGKAKSDHGKAE